MLHFAPAPPSFLYRHSCFRWGMLWAVHRALHALHVAQNSDNLQAARMLLPVRASVNLSLVRARVAPQTLLHCLHQLQLAGTALQAFVYCRHAHLPWWGTTSSPHVSLLGILQARLPILLQGFFDVDAASAERGSPTACSYRPAWQAWCAGVVFSLFLAEGTGGTVCMPLTNAMTACVPVGGTCCLWPG